MKKQKNRSVQNIYSTLKDRIVLMDYQPGELIREKVLMEEFDVSRTPVREALIRLETNELVKIVPNTGTFVTEVSFSKLQDLIELRTCLISFSGKLAARRITEEELEEMSKLIKEISESNDPKKIM
ncbi:MAG: GntR family transcriptional regulator, partial [Proteobacteria bacterium]|nr:GntR family transcriptional regulator [Pseudomonadota bacterium]